MEKSGLEFGWRMATFSEDGTPGATLVAQVEAHLRLLEGHVQSIWVQDHLIPEHPATRPEWDCLETWSALAHWAATFPAYRFGNAVLTGSFRSPALLAKMAATTQLLTRGRFILGLGAGWNEPEYRSYGWEYPPPRVRIAQLAEVVQIIRAMWTESPASFAGQHHRIDGAYCNPQPDPVPPIMIGGGGEQLMLRVVARHADWWCIPGGSFAQVEHKMNVLRQHCTAVGRDYDTIVKVGSVGVLAVAPTRSEAQRLAEASIFYKPDAVGSVIAGEPAQVADQLRRFADLGATQLIMRFADFPRLNCASRFVEQVLPLLR